jgi:predicted RNA-binding protein YlqC (UPF0109 family)
MPIWQNGMHMDLEAFLIDVLKPLLDHPDALRVEARGEGRKREFIIHADAADMGRIIGKSGRTIQSLRTLCKVAGDNAGLHVEVEVHDEDRA